MAGQASLVFTSEDGVKQDIRLERGSEATVGRHPQCTLTVSQPSVSRKHARFWFEDGEWFVEDLQSSNGTYVNNRRIEQEKLTEGDDVRCGDFAMKYVVEEHTREVGNLPPRKAAKKRTSGPPRLVGQMGDRTDIAGRATMGLSDPSEALAELKTAAPKKESPPALAKELDAERSRAQNLSDELRENRERLGQLESENQRLKRNQKELDELVMQRDAFEEDVKALSAKNSELKKELATVQTALNEVKDDLKFAESKKDSSEQLDSIHDLFEDLDSFTSDLRLKLKLASGLLTDLGPTMNAFDEVANAKLPAKLAQIVASAAEDNDVVDTYRAIMSTFEGAELAARRTRRLMRLLGVILNAEPDND